MRRLILLTDNRERLVCFDTAERSKSFEIEIRASKEWKQLLQGSPALIYLDLGSMSDREAKRAIRAFESQEEIAYGVVDPDGVVADPADLFHGGASDYIGPEMAQKKLPTSRISQASEFYPEHEEEAVFSDISWSDIREGEEYPFFFLYVELDILDEWKLKSGKGLISGLMKTFETHLTRVLGPLGGRLWMKNQYGGLFLFPYSEGPSDIIPVCMRLVMNRVLISTEVYSYGTLLPYHFALDRGTTVYRQPEKTGTLISDAVNNIFHLGQQHTPAGHFVLSQDAAEHIPAGLRDSFTDFGAFHERKMLRMKLPR